VDLPFGLGVQVDGLYQRINYEQFFGSAWAQLVDSRRSHTTQPTVGSFLLIQYSPRFPLIKPFVEAGTSISHIANQEVDLVSLG
jgi:hypothetical protein